MGRFYKYKRNYKEYDEILNSFLDEFEETFGKIYERNELYDELRKNIKVIKKLRGNKPSIKIPFKGYARGCYNPISKKLLIVDEKDKTTNHEIFHALARDIWLKRRKFFDSFFKTKDDEGLEEGITEHLATEMSDDIVVRNCPLEYKLETSTFKYLSRIYGNKMILDYYLGKNNGLIEKINRHNKNNFDNIKYVLRRMHFNFRGEKLCNFKNNPFENIYYDDNGNKKEFKILFDLFCKEKLIKVNTIDDFVHNDKEIFNYYKSDIIESCYRFKEWTTKDEKHEKYLKDKFNDEFEKLDMVLRREWNKLGTDDEVLYNRLIIEQIESLHDSKTPKLVPLIIDNTNFYKRYKKSLDNSGSEDEDVYLIFLQSLNNDENKVSYFDESSVDKELEKNKMI